ncbi:MAG: dTDP-4-amino-4,6-dideoxygalactose transaminase [Cognaticolwellia sp.]|jgi:dTDP-4-amino-4,6-dideoxygalactose transaminase
MVLKSPIKQLNNTKNVVFCQSARSAFKEVLNNLDFSTGKLLLPAYIGITDREGSGVFDPVEETQTPYGFYALDEKLTPEYDALIKIIKNENISAILFIHYFGFCHEKTKKLIELCKTNNVIVIEDCAHTLGSENLEGFIGTMADFSIYALHKVLPIKTGGMLKINNSKFNYLKDKISHDIAKDSLISYILSDYESIKNKRRKNYKALSEKINHLKGISLLYPELPNSTVPHNLPFIVKNNLREKLYFNLIKREIPVVALYYRMISAIVKIDFPNAYTVSENILNLPIHQDISDKDICQMAEALKGALMDVTE